jgi:hypothetical protein
LSIFLLREVDVLFEAQRTAHHFVGRRLPDAALDVVAGVDAGHETRWRQREFARDVLATGTRQRVRHHHPGVVHRRVTRVDQAAQRARLARVWSRGRSSTAMR